MMLRAIQDKVPMNELSDLNMIVREGRVSSEILNGHEEDSA